MKMLCWARVIPGRWFDAVRFIAFCCVTATAFAAEPAPVNESLNRLGRGIAAYNSRDYNGAVQALRGGTRIDKIGDYFVYYLAASEQLTGDFDGASSVLAGYRESPVSSSPLAGKISLLHGRVLLDKREPPASAKALEILSADYRILPQPDGDFALAMAYEAQGEKQQSAVTYQRVYYGYPNTDLAAQAWLGMERLRAALGTAFPTAPPRQQLERCEKWLDAKQYKKARAEYESLAESLTGVDRDDAKAGIGAVDFLSGDAFAALRYLKALKVARSQADAKRLYYLTEAARKTGDDSAMMDAVKELEERYAKSPWLLKALMAAGNRYLVKNEREQYTPLYRAIADGFPPGSTTALSHWRVAWDAYLAGRAETTTLMREHVERYPADSTTSTALYFLGRLAESDNKAATARAYYDRLSAQYPHYFYGVLARERLKDPSIAAVAGELEVKQWLAEIAWPARRDFSATEANVSTRLRMERGHLLQLAGLPDMAEAEFRFGAKNEGEQPQLLGLDLASTAETPFKALRAMKSFSSDYLSLPLENASPKFWQMLFPLPYKDDLFRSAHERDLDPYFVAGLIRQESEFNPAAKSHANAYGLMQLIPPTGKQLARQIGIKALATTMLFQPGLNIKLGTQYLRGQLDNWNGDWYQTLAAYNAGPGRVKEWNTWGTYRERAEFVESIPFNETREYVQAVLRNADLYKEIYAGKPVVIAPLLPVAKPVAKPAAKRPVVRRKKKASSSKRK